MEIIKTKVMRGPNCWSATNCNLIVLKLAPDTTAPDCAATDEMIKRLSGLHIPSDLIYTGLALNKLVGYVATALQRLAGMDCAYFIVQESALQCDADVIFTYTLESAGIYAASAAVDIINAMKNQYNCDWDVAIKHLSLLNRRGGFGPSTKAIVDTAIKRGIPVTRLDDESLLMLGYGAIQRIVRTAVTGLTSAVAVALAQDKNATKKLLDANYIPVPQGVVIDQLDELVAAINDIGFPLVVKPSDGNHGAGNYNHDTITGRSS
jgi:cyanophycin synthetase